MKKLIACVVFAVAALSLGGCATTRSTVTLNVPKPVANPTEGAAVKIATVVDARVFEARPPDPSIPSLKIATEITNPAITSRAIGRKRGGYGMALGDVLLPEGTTVAGMVQDAVTNAYRESGYRVLGKDDPGFDTATPVDVKIKQFWCWDTPGFWTMSLENRVEVVVTAPQKGFETGTTVSGYAIEHPMAIFESEWPLIASSGLADFTKNLKAQLKK